MTPDQLDQECRRINRRFWILGAVSAVLYLAIVVPHRLAGGSNLETSSLGAMVFQFLCIVWAVVFLAPYFVRMEKKTDISIRLGSKTAGYIEELQGEIKPIVADVQKTVHQVTDLVDKSKDVFEQFRADDWKKIEARWRGLVEDGTIDRLLSQVRVLPDKFDEMLRVLSKSNGVAVSAQEAARQFREAAQAARDPGPSGEGI